MSWKSFSKICKIHFRAHYSEEVGRLYPGWEKKKVCLTRAARNLFFQLEIFLNAKHSYCLLQSKILNWSAYNVGKKWFLCFLFISPVYQWIKSFTDSAVVPSYSPEEGFEICILPASWELTHFCKCAPMWQNWRSRWPESQVTIMPEASESVLKSFVNCVYLGMDFSMASGQIVLGLWMCDWTKLGNLVSEEDLASFERDIFLFLRICDTHGCWMSTILEAKWKFTSSLLLCIGGADIKGETQDPWMLSAVLQMFLNLLIPPESGLSLEGTLWCWSAFQLDQWGWEFLKLDLTLRRTWMGLSAVT